MVATSRFTRFITSSTRIRTCPLTPTESRSTGTSWRWNSTPEGTILRSVCGLVDVQAGDEVLVVAHRGAETDAKKVRTVDAR